ncbi:MAG: ATP-binding protein [Chloroflexi bacterium]|nr:ATP-binding protein [Chloroflexota bacterium]
MEIEFRVGPNVVEAYKRLAYTPWHALAEFVDNSTQSYFDHREELDRLFSERGEKLKVEIVYDHDAETIRVVDNAMGMSLDELKAALEVGKVPANTSGRSQYGLGLKTAACWFGDLWCVTTKRLGETVEHQVEVDVRAIAGGNTNAPYRERPGAVPHEHYTIVEIRKLNRRLRGRTLGKIKDYLASMYREDLRSGLLTLTWQSQELEWPGFELIVAPDGREYKKEFRFQVNGKDVHGWVGVLQRGSRSRAGFSILRRGRVVKGWPDSWRPSRLYGQEQGSNDLVNQRLVGEIHLDDFEVSHTKDDILWVADELDELEDKLYEACVDYRRFAQDYRLGHIHDARGPSEATVQIAVEEVEGELASPEMGDAVLLEPDVVPPYEAVVGGVVAAIEHEESTFRAEISDGKGNPTLSVEGFIKPLSPNDPYTAVHMPSDEKVVIVVNQSHPHWRFLPSEAVLWYLKHCVYDALAEWKAAKRASPPDYNTVKLFKDQFLRVPMEIEMRRQQVR